MRYCRFATADGHQYGLIEGDHIARLMPPPEEDARCKLATSFTPVPLSDARLLAPIVPSKIVCVGRNYREHASELGNEAPKEPLLFFKPPSAIIAAGDAIHRPSISNRVDYEGELGIVIGKTCARLHETAQAADYVRGYTIVNDVTARDLQKTDNQWARAKGFDTFCPVGPVVSDEIDATAVDLTTHLNGELKQKGNTRDFIFSIPVMLHYISHIMTLYPGDLIATGTPAGVSPMHAGDIIEISVAGLGVLRNPVI